MRVLVYKRTHNGDPDTSGCFGVYDCMGAVRDWEFDAVIGVGGIGPEARASQVCDIEARDDAPLADLDTADALKAYCD